MTNESISGFLNSIAEAKRAFDAEPEYQQRIRNLEDNHEEQLETIAKRELHILGLKQANEELMQKLRSVEAERDDAGFRALEADDKVQGLLTLVHQFVGDGLKAISAVEGRELFVIGKDEHQGNIASIDLLEDANRELNDELQRLQTDMRLAQEQLTRPFAPSVDTASSQGEGTDHWYNSLRQDREGQRAVDPTIASTPSSIAPEEVTNASSVVSGSIESQEGQSDGPFAKTEDVTPVPNAASAGAESETSAVSNASPPERNRDRSTFYKGRKYYDVTYYVPLHQWLEGGGTREDYEWRPLPEVNRASHQS